ncbi:hypothetical protein MQC27_25265, partial [Escherichia coli]|nr:hypothetical protein [Escherichia coli]
PVGVTVVPTATSEEGSLTVLMFELSAPGHQCVDEYLQANLWKSSPLDLFHQLHSPHVIFTNPEDDQNGQPSPPELP